MIRTFWLLVGALALWASPAAARLAVATTTPSLGALVKEIGGDRVEVTPLSAPSEDPHYVDARPSLILTLNKADLLVTMGMELESGWLPNLQTQARNAKILRGGPGYLEASAFIQPLEVPTGKLDRAMGDLHPGGNPHYLHDARAAARVVTGLGERMAQLDPLNAQEYRNNATVFAQRLERFATEQAGRFTALPMDRRQVVVYHASFPYLLDWLGLQQAATLEPRPGIAPSPGQVAQVLATMRSKGVRAILQEEYHPRSTSETLASMAKAKLVIVQGSARLGAESYLDHLRKMTDALYVALQQ